MVWWSKTQTSSRVRHDTPARVVVEEVAGVVDQIAGAELAAEAGEDLDPVPVQPRALEPVESADRRLVVLGELGGDQADLRAVSRRGPGSVGVDQDLHLARLTTSMNRANSSVDSRTAVTS